MFHFILKVSILALLLWVEAVAGRALAQGPADGGELAPTDLERVKVCSTLQVKAGRIQPRMSSINGESCAGNLSKLTIKCDRRMQQSSMR